MAALPAYMKIRQYVMDLITSNKDINERIMSEREMCKKFEVSRPTARRALKELIDEGYLVIRPGLGTFINPLKVSNNSLGSKQTYKVLVVFGDGRYTDLDGFSAYILEQICSRLKYLPMRLRMANLNFRDRESVARDLSMYSPDGVICVRPTIGGLELIKAVDPKLPTIITGLISQGLKNHITVDYNQCGHQAASWFLDQGLKDTVFVGNYVGPDSIQDKVFQGWCEEYKSRGLEFDLNSQADLNSNITEELSRLLSTRKFEGLFTFGSEFSLVNSALVQLGIAENELPIIADENYYGFYGSEFQPSAKIIMSPPEESAMAVDKLFDMMQNNGSDFEEIVITPPKL